MRGVAWFRSASSLRSRPNPWRDATRPRQLATATSIGASARAVRIDAAIIAPAETSPAIASQAPTPSTADCSTPRKTLAIEPMPLAASLPSRVCEA